jgi:phage tail tape-measure protein
VGVPLKVSGPLGQVQVSVPAGAVAGAALGTAVLPGIGTAIGARIGAAMGRIFESAPADQKSPAPARKLP